MHNDYTLELSLVNGEVLRLPFPRLMEVGYPQLCREYADCSDVTSAVMFDSTTGEVICGYERRKMVSYEIRPMFEDLNK